MDTRNDFICVIDTNGTEHHFNPGTVLDVTFDREGVATIYTAALLPSQPGTRYIIGGKEAIRLRAALARREGWATIPERGQLPEFRQALDRPRAL